MPEKNPQNKNEVDWKDKGKGLSNPNDLIRRTPRDGPFAVNVGITAFVPAARGVSLNWLRNRDPPHALPPTPRIGRNARRRVPRTAAPRAVLLSPPSSLISQLSRSPVKQRMKAVKNIQKITKAMKMVAASKLRGAQVRVTKSRGLWQPFARILGDTPGVPPLLPPSRFYSRAVVFIRAGCALWALARWPLAHAGAALARRARPCP